MSDRRQVVTILSCNYSGSHFVSLMIGSHSRARHIGQIRSLRRSYDPPRPGCHICDDVSQCPVVRGIDATTIGNAYDIIFDNFNDSSLTTLVDNSKKVTWAEQFLHSGSHRMKYIHLIRDPRALIRRWTMLYEPSAADRRHERIKAARHLPRRAAAILTGPQWRVYLYRWLIENIDISSFIRHHRLDHLLVTYRESAQRQEPTMRRIMQWLDMKFEPAQLDYWTVPHHGSQKPEYEWVKTKPQRFFDQRWREFLSPDVQAQIAANEDVRQYLASIGLSLEEEGLLPVDHAETTMQVPAVDALSGG